MFQAHFNAIEDILEVKGKLLKSAGHSLHKGNGREFFVKEFLTSHLGQHVSIGTGEIISSDSKPNEQRNQWDVVIYNNKIPKISYATDVDAFLIESICSLIEVKSNLDDKALVQAHKAAKNAKKMAKTRSNEKLIDIEELYEPRIFNYLFAYNSSLSLESIDERWRKLDKKEGLNQSPLPLEEESERIKYPSESLDGIFILKKGCIIFDNLEVELKGLMNFVSKSQLKSSQKCIENY